MQAAQQTWDAVKSDPSAEGHDEARVVVEGLRSSPPDYRKARDHLAEAVRAADDAYHAAVAELRAKHGVVMVGAER